MTKIVVNTEVRPASPREQFIRKVESIKVLSTMCYLEGVLFTAVGPVESTFNEKV